MRENNFKFLVILCTVLMVAIFLVPIHSGADPDLPDEAFAQTIPADDPFPHQEDLSPRVNFWRHVFGVWGSRQVALHDMSNPGLVYEVLTLPEKIRGIARSEFVNQHVEDLVRRLYILEQEVALGKELDDDAQGLLEKFRTFGKISQLAGAHTRVRTQYGIRDKFLRGVEASGRYDAIFRRIFRAHGVPEDLAFLPHVESSFQAHARSGAGAVGLWQFTLPAARTFMKVNAAVDERYDPVLAAEGCARYIARAHEKLGDWGLAITSYNHGIGGVARAKSEFGTDLPRILEDYEGPLFGFDSRNFYVEFLAAREVARNAERYFATVHRERPQSWAKVDLESSAPIYKVARDYGVTLSELTEMNVALTNDALKGRVSLPEGTSLWLPKDFEQRLVARAQEPEAPVERIRVVRTPDPTGGKMVAMIDDSLSTRTKIDVSTPQQRVLPVRAMDKEVSSSRGKVKSVKVEKATERTTAKAKVVPVKEASTKGSSTVKNSSAKMAVAKNPRLKTLAKVETKTKSAAQTPAATVKVAKVVPKGESVKVAKVVPKAKSGSINGSLAKKVSVAKPVAVKSAIPALTSPAKKSGSLAATSSKISANRRG
jgi:membrane-bound lytic murein transglycosylase D